MGKILVKDTNKGGQSPSPIIFKLAKPIETADIANNAITTTKIADEAVTADKLDPNILSSIMASIDHVDGKIAANTQAIATEKTRAEGAEQTLQTAIDAINGKIPAQATSQNQLADKAFVNSSVSTATADFKGTYNNLEDLEQITANANDYAFVIANDAAGNTLYKRYKWVEGTGWAWEYDLNNSSFTQAQWAAIQSGITAALVTKLSDLPDNSTLNQRITQAIANALLNYYTKSEIGTALGNKQDVIQDLATIRSGASAGATAVQPATLNSALSNTVAESGVYDVTANNNNAKFASLSALLSSENLDTLIPVAKRKGGMSIKFVLSSDNRYVQYRYMLNYGGNTTAENTKFVNTANWQGVDDEPTAGSDNLVKSGGTVKAIEKEVGNLIYGKNIDSDGSISDNPECIITKPIYDVSVGDTVYYKCGKGSNYYLVAYKVDGTKKDSWKGNAVIREITIPADTAYIRATFVVDTDYSLTLNGNSLINGGINAELVDIKKSISDNSTAITSLNSQLATTNGRVTANEKKIETIAGNITSGAYINVAGETVSDPDWSISNKINVVAGDSIKYLSGNLGTPSTMSFVIFYVDGSVATYYRQGGATPRDITIPNNAAYIVASFKNNPTYPWVLTINGVDAVIPGEISVLPDTYSAVFGNKINNKAVDTSSGDVVTANGYIATEKIAVTPGDTIKYLAGKSMSSYMYGLVAYKADGTKLSTWGGTNSEREISAPTNTAYIRATFYSSASYYLFVNNINVIVNSTNERVTVAENDIAALQTELSTEHGLSLTRHLMPFNMFGDILPPLFKNKLLAMDTDLLITCQGDSLTGLIEKCDAQADPQHFPPGCQYKSWIYLLQERVSKVKSVYDRLDSQHNNVDFFTKTGTWENVIEIQREAIYYSDNTSYGQERSVSALTFQCDDNSAAVAFVFDADTYEKCNIVFSKEPDGVLTKVVITEGNGKMLASIDRTTWVEANGFQVTQRTFDANGDDYTSYADLNAFTNACATNGIATRERHRRIWMKKVEGVTGEINISYQRDNTISYSDSYMYVWGIERYSGNAIFFDNIGRGGRKTLQLKAALSDIFDRNPDLAIYEMPLANEVGNTGAGIARNTLKGNDYYGQYFLSSADASRGDSFKYRSGDYTTMPIIVICPHGRSSYFDANNNVVVLSTQPAGEPDAYTCCKQVYGWLQDQLKTFANAKFINLYDQLINEALVSSDSIAEGFYGSDYEITKDGVHLCQYGADLWMKYLAGIFQV